MAKGQKRSSREAKKPKATKPKPPVAGSTAVLQSSTPGKKPTRQAR